MRFWSVAFAGWIAFIRKKTFIQTFGYCLASLKLKTGYKTWWWWMTVCQWTWILNTDINKLHVISSFLNVIILHTILASFSALASNLWPWPWPRALWSQSRPQPYLWSLGLSLTPLALALAWRSLALLTSLLVVPFEYLLMLFVKVLCCWDLRSVNVIIFGSENWVILIVQ